MVCRENKARSAVMGYEKHLMRQMGYSDYRDFEFQSAIHEYGHQYTGSPDPSPDTYEQFLHGARQQIINDPSISDADKYRQSDRQPGLVTRLDQEIERVRTGKDERGRDLTHDQVNRGQHFAAMKRLGVLIQRQQAARGAYLETYARSTGCTVDEARSRWDELADRPKEERENTETSLTDDWQQRLHVTGVTSQQQADMGQSNVTRETLRLMESERQAKIHTLPTRPTVQPEQRTTFLHPNDPSAKVQCTPDGCGQFGHQPDDCPHQAEVDQVRKATLASQEADIKAVRDGHAKVAENMLQGFEDGTVEPEPLTDAAPDAQKYYVIPGEQPGDDTQTVADRDETIEALRRVQANGDPASAQDSMLEAKDAASRLELAEDRLAETRGPVPIKSAAVNQIGYNSDTGLVEITAHPYTRKRTGDQMPAKTYLYRMAPSEYDEMMSAPSVGSWVSTHLWARESRGGNDRYKWENTAEEQEAQVQRQCPSCGQWASMTSAHQCPISGTMQSHEEAAYRDRLRQEREKARLTRLPTSLAATTPRQRVESVSTAALTDGGRMRFPERGQMVGTRDNGKVALGGYVAQYLGHRVTGRAYTWKEPGTGQPLYRSDNVSCTCGGPPCRHAEKAGSLMAVHYGAGDASGVTPGGRRFADPAYPAQDAPDTEFTRTPYHKIRQQRREAAQTQARVFADYPERRTVASWPLDAASGAAVDQPASWAGSDGRQVDVGDSAATASAVDQYLQERTGTKWKVVSAGDGAIQVSGLSYGQQGRGLSWTDQQRLSQSLGMPSRAGGKGVHIPADPSWRHEFLSRASGQEPTILGSRFIAQTKQAAGPQA